MAKLKLHVDYEEKVKEEKANKRIETVKKGWGNGFVSKPTFVKKMLLPHFWGA